MRSVAAGLRLPELAPMTVEDIAARAVQDHERRTETRVSLVGQDTPASVPLSVKIALFRALQEALSNATRHGGSTRVEVELGGTPGMDAGGAAGLALTVRDDGQGFDTAELGSGEGLGLAGIREQAEILGGTFSVTSTPGGGTELGVWWPLQASEPDV